VGYTHLPADDPSIESFRGAFLKIRRALGTNAFGINEIRMPAGFEGHEHDEQGTGHEEVYVVLEGGGTFTVDGDSVDVHAGDYLRVDPASTRRPLAGPNGMRLLVVAGKPQAAYDGRETL
jgi:mannose-6-phosphate isomerase-like protein (cupin superfamily)